MNPTDKDLETARVAAVQARDAATAADYARRTGSPDPDTALALDRAFVIAASACRWHERRYLDMLAASKDGAR